jgi:YfiH family protein
MPFSEHSDIRYFQFEIFSPAVTHAVIARRGGVSPAPWESLNVGSTVGDELPRVRENRQRSFAALGRGLETLFDVWQVHSADVVCAEAPRDPSASLVQADVLLTDRAEITLYMRFADCVPILLHDPVRGVVGMAHAGWLGTVRGAARAAVERMVARYESRPADILAGIGPSIGPDHYEIGPDVSVQIQEAFPSQAGQLLRKRRKRTYLDLWKANELQLRNAGVEQIELAGLCTACHLEDWFSHRAEQGKTGRFGALIGLNATGSAPAG